ncbi:GET complex subunit GET1 [Saccharomyces paradoxus]|uniref:Golgi to ER traffic protein 1 n=1 Tax=Saccharomyces paradoxus TaxID=27291 RepID=A0A8B8URN6_SACPA|nr:Get1 [Saccharomyces paradoxus]QHS73304.1 Get1 [Saccharomyces paradoxus]
MHWAAAVAVFFIVVTKFLQYTNKYHEKWISKFAPGNELSKKYLAKIKERHELKEFNNSISAQDNYAKWTKNNRKLDSLDKEINNLKDGIQSENKAFQAHLHKLKLLTLTVPFFVFKIVYGKTPIYQLSSSTSTLFPTFVSGVWSQGWLYVILHPLRTISQKWHIMEGKFGVSKFDGVALQSVSLGIWVWALMNVLNGIEFIVNQLFLTPNMEPPASTETQEEKSVDSVDDTVILD